MNALKASRISSTIVASALASLVAFAPVAARERLYRVLDTANGLPGVPVNSVAQDSNGFLWIATARGLARFDGVEMRPWNAQAQGAPLDFVVAGPAGEVLAARHRETLLSVSADGLVPLTGPDERPIRSVWDAEFDAEGRLWVAVDGRLSWRSAEGQWKVQDDLILDGERPFALARGCGRRMLVSTWDRRVWDVAADGSARVLGGPFKDPVRAMLCDRDGSVLAGVHWDGLWRLHDGKAEKLADARNRGLSLMVRGDDIWYVSVDDIVVIDGHGTVTHLGTTERAEGFGEAIIDREGSLWIASYRGLVHYAEPNTVVWQEPDGLPLNHTRFLARAANRVWVSTWSGLAHFEDSGGEIISPASDGRMLGRSRLCSDTKNRVWTMFDPDRPGSDGRPALVSLEGEIVRAHNVEMSGGFVGFGCTPSRDGGIWIAFGGSLLRVEPGADEPLRVGALPPELVDGGVSDLAEAGDGSLWCAAGSRSVCRATVPPDTGMEASMRWSCEEVPAGAMITDLHTATEGEIWIATDGNGVLHRGAGVWENVPGLERHAGGQVTALSPSPSGGVWISGPGFVERAIDSGGRWTIVEELTTWHGIPPTSVASVLEDPDGTVWLASLAGVVRIPAGVRETFPEAPEVTVTDVRVSGVRQPSDIPLTLPWDKNRLEVRFSTLSFRAPHLLRYRVRTVPDDHWTDTGEPSLQFFGLEPGFYTVELSASLDGRHWSHTPARLSFRVSPPWYRRKWAVALAAALLFAAGYGLYRMRMARVVGLERQRVQIAADLHDDMGAGLGGIGILAGVAAEADTPDAERRALAARVAEMAESLGAGLTDIVWSLRPDSIELESLAHYIVERASAMFAAGEPELVTAFPDPWPAEPLNLAVRRNLQLIALEALRNAARHAKARRVEFGFAHEGRRWTMWISDDGRGLTRLPEERGRGVGLTSMHGRARDMAADLRIDSRPGGGTRVEVRFRPRAEGSGTPRGGSR